MRNLVGLPLRAALTPLEAEVGKSVPGCRNSQCKGSEPAVYPRVSGSWDGGKRFKKNWRGAWHRPLLSWGSGSKWESDLGAQLLPAGERSGGLLHMCGSLCRSPVRTTFLGSGAWVTVCIGTCAHVFICKVRRQLAGVGSLLCGSQGSSGLATGVLSREHLTSILVVVVIVLLLKQGFSV